MISDETAKEMLRSIALSGAASEENKVVNVVLGASNNLNQILNQSSGLPRIRQDVSGKFTLLLKQPEILSALSSLEIRCCLCKRVISYPAWYHSIKYVVNHFHYFICFDSNSPLKPSTRCYKR